MIRLTRREFIRLAQQAYRQLPPGIQKVLQNVDVVVEEWPTQEDMQPDGEMLFGLYTGVPMPERGSYQPELPDRIAIYRQPIMRSCATAEEVVREVQVTLWHEVGHFLGLSEDDLHRLGYG